MVTTVDHLKRDPSLSAVAIDVSGQAAVVNVDAEQLQLAVQNVLMNAAQAMNGSGAIHVEITRDGANWTISVADTDPGMPAEVKAKAFEPFFHHSQPRHRPRPADRPACPRSTPRRYHRRHPGGRRHSRVDVAAGDVLNARPVRKFRHDGREFSRLLPRSPAPTAVSGRIIAGRDAGTRPAPVLCIMPISERVTCGLSIWLKAAVAATTAGWTAAGRAGSLCSPQDHRCAPNASLTCCCLSSPDPADAARLPAAAPPPGAPCHSSLMGLGRSADSSTSFPDLTAAAEKSVQVKARPFGSRLTEAQSGSHSPLYLPYPFVSRGVRS